MRLRRPKKRFTPTPLNGRQFDQWLTLIGKQVRVTMDRTDPKARSEGQLVGLTDDGMATVIEEDGIRHYVWPALEVKEL